MTISTLSSLSSQLLFGNSSLASTASNGGSDALSAALAALESGNSASSSLPAQDQVTLSSLQALQSQGNSSLYTMQGLLEQSNANLMGNDPLLQSADTSANNSGSTTINDLLSLAANEASNVDAEATSGSTSNADWAKALKQDPSLAGLMVSETENQSLVNMLG